MNEFCEDYRLKINKEVYQTAADILSKANVKRVLEIGCNTGYGLEYIRQKLSKGIILEGWDISPQAIRIGKSKYREIKFKIKDICKSTNDKNKYDALLCFEVLEHIRCDKKFFRNIKKLLKAEGLILLSTPNREIYDIFADTADHINEKTLEELINTFSENKIEIINIIGFSLTPWWVNKILKTMGVNVRKRKIISRLLKVILIPIMFPRYLLFKINHNTLTPKRYTNREKVLYSPIIMIIGKIKKK